MTDRTTARLVGVLFILATVTAIVGGTLVVPVTADPPTIGAAGEGGVVSGVLLELVLVASVVGIAAMLFPVLRRVDEGLAAGYLGARIVEGVLLLAAALSALVVLDVAAGDAAAVGLVQATRDVTYLVGSMVALGAGAVILYSLLLRGRLVPVWLSAWGLVGGVMILARGVAELYGVEFSVAAQGLLAAPIAINEMVLAVLLIARGFRTTAGTSPDRPARSTVDA